MLSLNLLASRLAFFIPVCAGQSHTFEGECDEFVLINKCTFLFLAPIQSSVPAHSVAIFIPDVTMIVPSPFMLPSRMVARVLSFTHPIVPSRPVRGNFVPDVPTIVPLPLMLPSGVAARVVFHPFCLRGLPPPCTSLSEDAFQGVDHRVGSGIADPSHGSPHTFRNHLTQKR